MMPELSAQRLRTKGPHACGRDVRAYSEPLAPDVIPDEYAGFERYTTVRKRYGSAICLAHVETSDMDLAAAWQLCAANSKIWMTSSEGRSGKGGIPLGLRSTFQAMTTGLVAGDNMYLAADGCRQNVRRQTDGMEPRSPS